jgi:hypothetical protein
MKVIGPCLFLQRTFYGIFFCVVWRDISFFYEKILTIVKDQMIVVQENDSSLSTTIMAAPPGNQVERMVTFRLS